MRNATAYLAPAVKSVKAFSYAGPIFAASNERFTVSNLSHRDNLSNEKLNQGMDKWQPSCRPTTKLDGIQSEACANGGGI